MESRFVSSKKANAAQFNFFKNPIKILKFFSIYKKNIKLNEKFLNKKFGLNIDNIYRLWTVVDLSSIPKDIRLKLGDNSAVETELKKYLKDFNDDLPKIDLDELVNIYDIKVLGTNRFGITFGFSLYNNLLIYAWIVGVILLGLGILGYLGHLLILLF